VTILKSVGRIICPGNGATTCQRYLGCGGGVVIDNVRAIVRKGDLKPEEFRVKDKYKGQCDDDISAHRRHICRRC